MLKHKIFYFLSCKMRTIATNRDPNMMMTLEQIRAALKDRNLSAVARGTGLDYGSVYAIATQKTTNPSYKTVAALSSYLSKQQTTA